MPPLIDPAGIDPAALPGMGAPALLELFLGAFLLPPLIALLQQPRWPKGLKVVLTVLVACGFAALKAGYLDRLLGQADPDAVRAALLFLIGVGSTYNGLWKPSGVTDAVERATAVPALDRLFSPEGAGGLVVAAFREAREESAQRAARRRLREIEREAERLRGQAGGEGPAGGGE